MEFVVYVAQFFRRPKYDSDSPMCKIIYRGNAIFLLTAAVLTFLTNTFGSPITCMGSQGPMQSTIEDYCYKRGGNIYGAHRKDVEYKPLESYRNVRGTDPYYVTIDPGLPSHTNPMPEKINFTFILYYPLFYFIFCVLNYGPRLYWRYYSGRLLEEIIGNILSPHLKNKKYQDALSSAATRFVQRKLCFQNFTFVYFVVLGCYVLILLLQLFIMVTLIGRSNVKFPVQAFQYFNEKYRHVPLELAKVFPRSVNCQMKFHESGGNVAGWSGLCHLHYMIMHQLFFSIYFWLACIEIVGVLLEMIWLLVALMLSSVRAFELRSYLKLSPDEECSKAYDSFPSNFYLLVNSLRRNVGPLALENLIVRIADELQESYEME